MFIMIIIFPTKHLQIVHIICQSYAFLMQIFHFQIPRLRYWRHCSKCLKIETSAFCKHWQSGSFTINLQMKASYRESFCWYKRTNPLHYTSHGLATASIPNNQCQLILNWLVCMHNYIHASSTQDNWTW